MKRNMDLLRAILLAIEETPNTDGLPYLEEREIKIDGYSVEEISSHLLMLDDLGFVELYPGTGGNPKMRVRRMTVQGHEFIDNARNDEAWKEVTEEAATKAGGVGLAVLTALLVSWAKEKLGLD